MPFDQQNVMNWLRSRDPACPVCGQKGQWQPLSDFVGLADGPVIISTIKPSTFVYAVALDCKECGYRMLVSAAALGYTPSEYQLLPLV